MAWSGEQPVQEEVREERIGSLLRQLAEIEAELSTLNGERSDTQTPIAIPLLVQNLREALRDAETRHRRLVNRLELLVFELAPDGTTLLVNEALLSLTGYAPHEVLGTSWWLRFYPGDHLRLAHDLFRKLRVGDICAEPIMLMRKDGEQVTLSLTTANSYNRDGALQRIVATASPCAQTLATLSTDTSDQNFRVREAGCDELNRQLKDEIAERQRAEQAYARIVDERQQERERLSDEIAQQAAELDATVSAITDGLIIYDVHGRIVRINEVAERFFDSEISGRSNQIAERLARLRITDELGTVLTVEQVPSMQALRGKTVQSAVMVVHHDDRSIWLSSNAAPICTADGRILGVMATFTDITAQQELLTERERLLVEVERRAAELDAIISSMVDGVILYDAHGEIVRVNPAAQRMLRDAPDVFGTKATERLASIRITHADGTSFNAHDLPVYRAGQGETVNGVITVLHYADGAITWLSASAAPILDTDSGVIGAVLTLTDITASHELQMEQELFVHTISHDLRAPLTIVNGHAQLLAGCLQTAEVTDDQRAKQYIDAITRGVRRMNVMIEDLVDMARMGGSSLQLYCQPIVLIQFLTELLSRSGSLLDGSRIAVTIPDDLPVISADPHRLERIFINLLTNAFKYSPPESQVEVVAALHDECVTITVRDYGQGIDTEDIPHLFERFYRTKHGRKPEGIGLGLYITRMLVEAHGGCISVESKAQKGSAFTVTLPVYQESESVAGDPS